MKKLENPKIKQAIYLNEKQYKKLNAFQYKTVKNGMKQTYSSIIENLIEKYL